MNTIRDMQSTDLDKWIDNFKSNQDLPIVTTSIILSRGDLEEMTEKLKDLKADGIRLYFIRFNKEDKNYKYCTTPPYSDSHITFVEKDLTQVSIAMVPTNQSRRGENQIYLTKDLVNKDGTYTVFVPGGESTGLCPPNCKY